MDHWVLWVNIFLKWDRSLSKRIHTISGRIKFLFPLDVLTDSVSLFFENQ